MVEGLLKALRTAIENDTLESVSELAHASFSSDILDQARELLDNGYKDAAAVMIGSALETHLRNLCEKHEIETRREDSRGHSIAKKASLLNDELKKANVYNDQEQKQILAWLGLRNSAAHGEYKKYEEKQVRLMLEGIMLFTARHPA